MELNIPQVRLIIESGTDVFCGYINYDNNFNLRLVPYYKLLRLVSHYFRLPFIDLGTLETYREAQKKAKVVYHDCTTPLPFADNTVDETYSSHVFEHMYHLEVVSMLREFHRVLRPDGSLTIEVPDLGVFIQQYIESVGDPVRADRFMADLVLFKGGGAA